MRPIASIVVPAHNEETVIAANLRRLLAGTESGEFDVIVVANACSDATAVAARTTGVRVIETGTPGKPNAIRLGDAACQTFPRVYADADVGLTADGVRALVAAVGAPGIMAAAPVPQLDLDGVGPIARRVHRVHDALVAPGRALAGVGVYVLNEDAAGNAIVLFPLAGGEDPLPAATVTLPGGTKDPSLAWEVTPGADREEFIVVVSLERLPTLDSALAGWVRNGPEPATRSLGRVVSDEHAPLIRGERLRALLSGLSREDGTHHIWQYAFVHAPRQ